MLIKDLDMNKDSILNHIQCKMKVIQKVQSTCGKVEMLGENQFKFITKDSIIDFCIIDRNEARLVMELFNRHFFCLANIISYSNIKVDNKVFFLDLGFFYNLQRWGKVPIILDNNTKEEIKKKYVKRGETLEGFLKENFYLSDSLRSYFAYTSDEFYFQNSLKEDELKEVESTQIINDANNKDIKQIYDVEAFEKIKIQQRCKKETLIIYGKKFCIYALIEGEGLHASLRVKKIKRRKQNTPMMRLAEGMLEFVNSELILSNKVRETLEGTKGYLELWSQYAEQEGILLLERARKVGIIRIERNTVTVDSNGIHVPYAGLTKDAEELITNDCFLLFSDKIPIYLVNKEMTWSDYCTFVKNTKSLGYSMNKEVQVRVSSKKKGGFILNPEDGNLPNLKYVSLSILGDQRQIARREEARHRIAIGQSANPGLGLILEGQLTEELGTYSTRRKIDPLSSFVRDKIFKYNPTETQKKAIDIALNTPDIAIIQGPPGTGKTTVITAIIERLNEICDKTDKISGQVLITSFQHDAVRNVIERLRINSLPTLKFGKQERNGEEDLTREKLIEEWCENYILRLNERNPELAETEQRNLLSKLHNIYLAYPSDRNALEFLNCAKAINTDVELDERINRIIQVKEAGKSDKNSNLVSLIRRLRVTKEGFMDDGADGADYLLQNLEDIGINKKVLNNKKVCEVLEKAALYYGKEPDDKLLNELMQVKDYLLEKCIPKPSYKKDIPDSNITEIYKHLNQDIKKYKHRKSAILAELLKELRVNRGEVEKSLEHYLFVYSATTQQSEGKEIREAKGIRGFSNKHPEYETVIVDEAARVSPSDLMIPLSQAKKRIILVGDHRQLPHIYDEEVFESMKENGEDFDMSNIKKSMFEYLVEKGKELERIDSVPRTIILDAQYRMHPMLGQFINEVFYKPYNEYFSSPLPASNYIQLISKKPVPIEWYNFPDKYGTERKEGKSRIRDCEANFIVEKIKEYLYSKEGKDLSYGVITFYSEQVKKIKEKLKNKLGKDAERIRVGSVDAFQGMEFDVIFLSVVRSSASEPMVRIEKKEKPRKIDFNYLEKDISELSKDDSVYKEWKIYKDTVGIQNFGFLISENRLCVALSRQKRLLIVVGNTDIFHVGDWGRVAKVCIPAMKYLYELCEREGVVYDGYAEDN